MEDCLQVSTRLERTLLGAGQTVVRVPPKLTAGSRSAARTRGKSDSIDALAIARAALREPDLPVAILDGQFREVRLLVDHREDLVAARTQMQNRLRWHLHELEPGREPGLRCLDWSAYWTGWRPGWPDANHRCWCGWPASSFVRDIRAHTVRINELHKELSELVTPLAPRLLELPGCGVLTAAKLIGELGQVSRFRSESCLAMHAGVAPIPASSGKTTRYRLARGGNRQLNAALHRIALSQIRLGGPGSVYYHDDEATATSLYGFRGLPERPRRQLLACYALGADVAGYPRALLTRNHPVTGTIPEPRPPPEARLDAHPAARQRGLLDPAPALATLTAGRLHLSCLAPHHHKQDQQ